MRRLISLVLVCASPLFIGCAKEDDAAKRENERLRAEMEAMKAEKAREEAALAMRENERLKSELAAAQARTTPASASRRDPPPSSAPSGRKIVDEFRDLKEGQQLLWRVPPGRYRVRATASNKGLKVKWVGAECASTKEVKVYDDVCTVSADAQLVVENPAGLTGLGPTEQVAVSVITM